MNTDEKIKALYPFQYYTFSNISNIEKTGFSFDDYSFKLEHNNELYFGNINGLICRHDMGYPLRLLKYLEEEPDTMRKRKVTFLLPENYRECVKNLKGLRQNVFELFDCPKLKDQIKVITYKVDNSDVINKIEELKNMPKFDVCIGNPPFEGNGNPLYLQILEKVNSFCNSIVWICPSQWIKKYKDNAYLIKIKTKTCKNLIAHYHINNPFNDATVANEIGIYVFGNANSYEDYEKIRYERYLNPILAKNIISKFEQYNDNLFNHNRIDNKFDFYVNATEIRGNVHESKPRWDWTTLFGQEQRINFTKAKKIYSFWNFKTIDECKNFIASTETDIFMFSIFVVKNHQKNPLCNYTLMPWFGDYTHKWTEEMIAQELGLTEDEVKYIHEEMKNFGWKAAPQK